VSLFFGKKNSILFSIKQIALQKNNKAICSTLESVWSFFLIQKSPGIGDTGARGKYMESGELRGPPSASNMYFF